MEYPADCALSADNEKRSKFTPCDHEGPCGAGCPCVEDQVHCEKACACPIVHPPPLNSEYSVLTFRTVPEGGEDVRVNAAKPAGRGPVNVINGHGNAMWIYVGVVMRQRFWIRLILPRSGTERFSRADVPIYLFSAERQRGL